ncbi:CheR family methyltransferase [uncultured Polaribacter sp.]|uniref:CheR family methyltransferase n=1 Tax=uncultured Polaribacter sp. TaxID=174711 RepID=UPI002638586A|nr:CheR family methyltransferase [uncultured Polaribacter sp.]
MFSNHNLIKSPPFIRVDLISYRNLLIYLDKKIQQKVMYNFHFALNKFGYLFLGNSESLEEISKFYKTIDVKWKILQNISEAKNIVNQNKNGYKYFTSIRKIINKLTSQILWVFYLLKKQNSKKKLNFA